METKSLVEELRDMVELSTINDQHPTLHADAILGHLCVSRGDERELFTAIADRIEREYMPLLEGKPLRQEALDVDGVPIIVGDVVYFVDNAEAFYVLGVESDGDDPVHIGRKDGTSTDAWVSPGELTHKQPDSLERIENDAMKMYNDYWGCRHVSCHDCPAMADGKKPHERYATGYSCVLAKTFDLLRRQRELLERGQE